jgi:hypothetical protein
VEIPRGEWDGLTVTGWARIKNYQSNDFFVTTQMLYAPEPVQRFNPNLVSNSFGYVSEIGVTGTVAIADFEWRHYACGPVTNIYRNGVYTFAGWSSNACSVYAGGNTLALGSGEINRNLIAGTNNTVLSLSTTGLVSIGVSLCPAAEFFNNIDGVADTNSTQGTFTGDSSITNELSFCSWRISLTATEHIYRSDLTRLDRCTTLGITTTNAMPSNTDTLSSRGIYKIGFTGIIKDATNMVEVFDMRVTPRWLSDDELCRIWTNGVIEIGRREIPRWK